MNINTKFDQYNNVTMNTLSLDNSSSEMPTEILVNIFERLSIKDACKIGLVSKEWNQFFHDIEFKNEFRAYRSSVAKFALTLAKRLGLLHNSPRSKYQDHACRLMNSCIEQPTICKIEQFKKYHEGIEQTFVNILRTIDENTLIEAENSFKSDPKLGFPPFFNKLFSFTRAKCIEVISSTLPTSSRISKLEDEVELLANHGLFNRAFQVISRIDGSFPTPKAYMQICKSLLEYKRFNQYKDRFIKHIQARGTEQADLITQEICSLLREMGQFQDADKLAHAITVRDTEHSCS